MGSGSPVGLACHVAFSNTDTHSSCSFSLSHWMNHDRRCSSHGVSFMPCGFFVTSFEQRYPEQLMKPFFSFSRHFSDV